LLTSAKSFKQGIKQNYFSQTWNSHHIKHSSSIRLNYSSKHGNMKNHQNSFNLQGICMSNTNYSIHTYPKHNESTRIYAWRHVAQKGYSCIVNSLDKMDIYMKLIMNTWKLEKLNLSLKQMSFQGICMNCQHNKYTYISLNTNESIYVNLHERQMTQRVYMYILKFWQNKHIHEMKYTIIKQIQKWEYKFNMNESSKLDYTSTSNGFK